MGILLPSVIVGCGGGPDTAIPLSALPGGTASSAVESSTVTPTLCGYSVGARRLAGSVIGVTDGDTVRVRSGDTTHDVRLDGIDAPELAQPFGERSHAALLVALDGKAVQIAYEKTDRYGRIVGAVFTSACQFANLDQLAAGLAWFYREYQCELSTETRARFEAAESRAREGRLGLWAQDAPIAPWVYRNGTDPVAPVCSSDGPSGICQTTPTFTS